MRSSHPRDPSSHVVDDDLLDDAEGEAATLPGGDEIEDPRGAWFDAALRVRVAQLLLADLRAECTDLGTWAERGADERPDDPAADPDDEEGTSDRRPPVDRGAVQTTLEEHRSAALDAV